MGGKEGQFTANGGILLPPSDVESPWVIIYVYHELERNGVLGYGECGGSVAEGAASSGDREGEREFAGLRGGGGRNTPNQTTYEWVRGEKQGEETGLSFL